MRLLPESGQVLLAAAIVSASIIVRPAQPVIADPAPSELPTIVLQQDTPIVNITHEPANILIEVQPPVVNLPESVPNEPVTVVVEPAPVLPAEVVYVDRDVERIVTVEVERIVLCDAFNSTDRAFAFIDNGLVTNVAGGSGAQFQSYLNAVAGQGREITCVEPRPGIGWTFDGDVFAPPS